MTVHDFLARLDGVRRTARGWSAQCPAHHDKSPSLSIREAEDGRLLIHDFAGCSVSAIVTVMGLTLRDLFDDALSPRKGNRRPIPPRLDRAALAFRLELAALDRRLRADRIIEAGRKVTVATLNDEELARAITLVAQAYTDADRADVFEHVADTVRVRRFLERSRP
ncbi:MAG: hypothetical protein GDA67_01840 [Nitrospira sp. CR1.3]|nr:hypothetical protein [Nitrospira sp. CR1.3]